VPFGGRLASDLRLEPGAWTLEMTFEQLIAQREWRPLKNCPGRFVLSGGPSVLRPQDLAGADTVFSTFEVPTARDAVLVGRLETGGLISYSRRDGTYVHTLNTPEGFERKLQQLGILADH
jgi:hypothetical protein